MVGMSGAIADVEIVRSEANKAVKVWAVLSDDTTELMAEYIKVLTAVGK